MKLSVIIPCYNASATIADQLEALANQQWSEQWEVVVSDNGSTDNSMEIVKQYQNRLPYLRIVDASARRGQPYALNVGIQAATGESLALCDADDEVAPGWLIAMGEALSKYDFVACRIDIDKLNAPWVRKNRKSPQQDGIQKYDYPPYLPHAGGGTIGFKRWLYDAIGCFEESFPLLHDTDFCWKAQLKGLELHFVPDAAMHVRLRDTIKGIYRQARGYGEYNVKIYKKYLPLGMPKLSWKQGVFSWKAFIMHFMKSIPRIRDKGDLAYWAWQFGWYIGRLKGSIKYRVFVL
ncbi:glycosyltransferase [Candidatus Kuenenia sp.]|uniref:glycosyltransferase family 2 protein n=1 Tax=Candidatus Kuenenia sp. TaxID=2499824 RepID=UPI00321FE731